MFGIRAMFEKGQPEAGGRVFRNMFFPALPTSYLTISERFIKNES